MHWRQPIAAMAAGVCLLFTMPLAVSADGEQKTYDDGMFTFGYTDGGVELVGVDSSAFSVRLPAETNGRRIVGIADGAFYGCSTLESVTLPDGLKYIGRHAFSGCEKLRKLDIPDTVETIGANALSACVALEELHLPEKLREIPEGLCYTCALLKTVNLPDTVTKIGDEAFYCCYQLQDTPMPANLTELGNYAFAFCTGFTELDLPAGVRKLSGGTFCGCEGITEFTVPQQMEDLGSLAFMGCTNLSAYTVEEGNLKYTATDGVLYTDSGATLFAYPAGNPQTSFTVPEGVTIVFDGSFFRAEHLTDVKFPSTLQRIGAGAFEYCTSLKTVSLPEGTELVYENAFADCTSLYAVSLPSTLRGVGNYVFYNCPKLKEITVPKNCKTVGQYSFGYIEQTDAEGNSTPVKLEGFRQHSEGLGLFKILAIIFGVIAGGALIVFLVRIIKKNQMTAEEHEQNVLADEDYTGITEETENENKEEQV